jgi:cytochrome c biogenesis protein CcmG, thiol:disulfide interchange protein DsbE
MIRAAGLKIALALLFLGGFAVFSIKVKNQLNAKESPLGKVKLGEPMPDFELPDASGQMVKFSDVCRQNKLVLINFWASWCTPCRMEMPQFEKIYAAKKNLGFALLAVNEDSEREKADAYLKSKPVSFPVLMDTDGAVSKQFGVKALPTTILVGQDGKVLQVVVGMEPYVQWLVESHFQDKKHER